MESTVRAVILNPQEVHLASYIGLRRRLASLNNGFKDRRGLEKKEEAEKWFTDICGALGEIAFAKYANLYWPASINAPKGNPDVCPDWQVRCAPKPDWDLIVRSDDPSHFKYALMTGDFNTYIFRGWIEGNLVKDHIEWFEDRGGRNEPVYWVPQSALNKELP